MMRVLIADDEAPARLKRGHRDDLLRRTASTDYQYFCRAHIAKTCREHARRQVLTGVITCQCDTALSSVLIGPCVIKLFS